jgi:steroid 5-alpha reductase family enzyme
MRLGWSISRSVAARAGRGENDTWQPGSCAPVEPPAPLARFQNPDDHAGARVPVVQPLVINLWIYAGVCAATWILSLVTREYSWVDRIWSLVPLAYMAVYAGAAGFDDARLDVMLAVVVVWGARLTFNFARKGGYAKGGEDYRWAVLRERITGWRWQLFNLVFIVAYQNAILWLITAPGYTAFAHRGGFGVYDVIATVVFLGCTLGETIADQQQWNFHEWKKSQSDPHPRFLQTGLFRYSRHPNFFFEQAQWWVIFAFGAIAAGSAPRPMVLRPMVLRPMVLQPTVLGAVLLTLLFMGSTRFTESISRSKYPEYTDYQATTSAIVPWPPKRVRAGAAKSA